MPKKRVKVVFKITTYIDVKDEADYRDYVRYMANEKLSQFGTVEIESGEFDSSPKKENVKHPICPLEMYFEGDEDRCDSDKCNFDINIRSCSLGCGDVGS